MQVEGPVDGDPGILNYTQAERSGFVGLLRTASLVTKWYNIRHGEMKIHVYNMSSFQQEDLQLPSKGVLCHHFSDYDLKQIKKTITD